jgi:HMG (high mobility group) box
MHIFFFCRYLIKQGKIAGAEWKKLSSEDRVKYEKMAATDKARYESEMKDYVPPKGSKDDTKNNKTKKPKAKKDPNAPKKPLTSFMLFSNEVRSRIQKQNPSMTFGELGKKIGELFRGLSSAEKLKYEDMSKKEKERYKKQMQEFENKQKANDDGVDEDDDDDDDDDDNDGDDDDDDE